MERNEVVVLDFFDTQKEEEKDTRGFLFFSDLYSLILNQEFGYRSTTEDSVRDER